MLTEIKQKIDNKTKPLGSLGKLEKLAEQVCYVQQSLTPTLLKPTIVVFAGDHGAAQSGISAYPAEVTPQMVLNFLNGGAAINVFSNQHNIGLKIVDAGVNYDFEKHHNLIHAKVAKGTKNYLEEPAITLPQLNLCFDFGKKIVSDLADSGCNIIGFGEMGIGSTSSASLLMSSLTGLPLEQCIGKGTGLSPEQVNHKLLLLRKAQKLHSNPENTQAALLAFGGFEIAQMCAAMLEAFAKNMLILVDGFIASAAFLCAYQMNNNILKNAIFCHLSDEQGHKKLLDYFRAEPLLQLSMRLGEGTGCALAYPIIESAINFINLMASFESAGVSNKS